MKIFESHSICRAKRLCARKVSTTKGLSPICAMALAALVLDLAGCGETAKLPTASSSGQVQTYFTGNTSTNAEQVTIDHYGKQLSVQDTNGPLVEGTFTTTASGVISITETTGSGRAVNTPQPDAWLVEMTGVGAVGNFLQFDDGTIYSGEAVMMAGNTECPSFSKATRFLFVTVPVKQSDFTDPRSPKYYGTTDISTQGSSVDFNTSYYTLGQPLTNPTTYQGDAACSTTEFGSVISYPVNQFAGGNSGYSAIGESQFLSGAIPAPPYNSFLYVAQNVVGLAMPSSAVSTTALSSTHFVGLLENPSAVQLSAYDPSVLAGAFGDEAGTSSACSSFQTGITASVANKSLNQAPSAQAIYGGDFPKTSTNPTATPGASGTETCDMAIDLGTQDATNNGLFFGAQLYTGTSTAVTSTSGTAIVSQIDGRSVILFRTYSTSSSGQLLVLFQALQ